MKAGKGKGKGKGNGNGNGALPIAFEREDPAVILRRRLARDLDVEAAFVAGLDEAGRGPLAGPVVAAACVLPVPLPRALLPLNDSKQLTAEIRDALFPVIVEKALAYGVCVVEAQRIDEINILRASLEAMATSLEDCESMLSSKGLGDVVHGAVIDGNVRAPLPARVFQKTIIGGDGCSRPIMAASILAKVTRDRRMLEEHGRFPAYGFDAHKGYGTPQHLVALAKLGPCELHRRSFSPVRIAAGGAAGADQLAQLGEAAMAELLNDDAGVNPSLFDVDAG